MNMKYLAATGLVTALGVSISTPAISKSVPTDSAKDATVQRVGEMQLIYKQGKPASYAYELLQQSSATDPIEIHFKSGEWSGGSVLTGDSPRARAALKAFLANAKSAKGKGPIVGVGSTSASLTKGRLAEEGGVRQKGAYAAVVKSTAAPATQDLTAATASECKTNCDFWINNASNVPSVPTNGRLNQFRMQGFFEVTEHTIHGLGKYGYPAKVHRDASGKPSSIRPSYIYEHDYKVNANGYAAKQTAVQWETNLPGAYLDTDAAGLEIGNGAKIEYTVGSLFTWTFDSKKTYTITTYGLADKATANSSSAQLTASVIPNDGGRSKAQAALKGGCSFGLVPPVSAPGVPPAYVATGIGPGDVAWCGGIGNLVNPSYVRNESLIMTPPKFFPVKYSGTCYDWTHRKGYTSC
ncbi:MULTISPECIES: hypothetical protein [Dermacoccus]|nr:hypothetical protein [Dermacoccus abyssi]